MALFSAPSASDKETRTLPRSSGTTETFERWRPYGNFSIAYRLMRHDGVDLNDHCWHAQGVMHHAQKALAASGGGGPISTVLDYGNDLGRRSTTSILEAKKQFKAVDNWGRLATIINVSSSLELYIRRAVRLSLQSDPGLLIGRPRIVDGVLLLKSGELPDVDQQVTACTEHVWSAREHALGAVFRGRIDAVFTNLSQLEFLRKLRNSVAHDFARTARRKDFWYLDPEQAQRQEIERISSERLLKLLQVAGAVASEIEERARTHVGAFELMLFWHDFLEQRNRPKNKVLEEYNHAYRGGAVARLLSSFHNRMVGGTLPRSYCEAAIRHYRSL